MDVIKRSVLLWTAFSNIFNYVIEDGLFDATIEVYLIGITVLITVVLSRKEYRYDLLTVNTQKTSIDQWKQ